MKLSPPPPPPSLRPSLVSGERATNYMKFQLSQVMDGFLAQSPLFVDILRGYVDGAFRRGADRPARRRRSGDAAGRRFPPLPLPGTFDAAQTNVRVCDGVREGDFYPELRPDRLSFPAPHFLDAEANLGTSGIVESVACSNDLAVALCAGARRASTTRTGRRARAARAPRAGRRVRPPPPPESVRRPNTRARDDADPLALSPLVVVARAPPPRAARARST